MPNRTQRSDLRAGIFILLSIALILGVIVAIKGVSTFFVHEEQRKVSFGLTDDLGGLRDGDDVRLGGVKVGTVQSIDIVGLGAGEQPHVLVRFTMPRKYPLAINAHMTVQPSLTGTSLLNIDALGNGPVLLADQELTGHLSGFSSLMAQAGEALPEVRQIIDTVRTSTLPHIDAATAQLPDTLAHARTAVDEFGSTFGDTKPDIRGTMANLNAITTSAKAKLPAMLQHIDEVMVKASSAIDSAAGTMDDLRATAANARDITSSARGIITGNRGKFDVIVASLKTTSENLKQATAEVRRNPWRLLYHPAPGEMENLELYDATRQFADGANNVNDAALALRDAMADPTANHEQVQKLVDNFNASYASFHAVEEKLWASVKK